MGTYATIVSSNPAWLLLAIISWGYYFTIMGTLATFLIDAVGVAIGSSVLAIVLSIISLYERIGIMIPFDLSYSASMYLVAKALASRERPS